MAAAGSTDREAEAKSYTFVNLHVHTTAALLERVVGEAEGARYPQQAMHPYDGRVFTLSPPALRPPQELARVLS